MGAAGSGRRWTARVSFRSMARPWGPAWRTAVIAASLTLSAGVYGGVLGGPFVHALAEVTALWAARALALLGMDATAHGTVIASPGFAADIVAECTALGPFTLLAGAVMVHPSPLGARAAGLVMGLVLLSAVNLVRIVSLFWIGASYPGYLDVAHLLVWQAVMLLLTLMLWLIWVRRTEGRAHEPAAGLRP